MIPATVPGAAGSGPPPTEQQPAPPSDYRLMVPAGWVRIALDPAIWPRRIASLVEERFKGVDNAPHIKAQMRQELEERAKQAWSGGGVELYLSMMNIEGVPVSASLLVTLIPYEGAAQKAPLGEMAMAMASTGAEVTMVELPAGFAMAHRYSSDPEQNTGSAFSDTHYDVTIDVPNSTARLLLSFSTPVEPLADVLVELFESIAFSLTWRN